MKKLREIYSCSWYFNLLYKRLFSWNTKSNNLDISFLVCDSYGWILDGICKEIIKEIGNLSFNKTNSRTVSSWRNTIGRQFQV